VKRALGCLGALWLAAGCGGPNNPPERAISSGPVSGKIAGQTWTFGTGEAALVRGSSGVQQYLVHLYPGAVEACVSFGMMPGRDLVSMLMPTAVGSYQLGYDLSSTLVAGSIDTRCVAIEGRLVIDDITATTLTGGLFVNCGPGNTIDGQFTAVICP